MELLSQKWRDKFLSIPQLLKIDLVEMVEKIEKSWTVWMLERTVERITPARIDSYDDCNGNGMLTPFGTGTLNTYPLEYHRWKMIYWICQNLKWRETEKCMARCASKFRILMDPIEYFPPETHNNNADGRGRVQWQSKANGIVLITY